jgi:hypothetical protein
MKKIIIITALVASLVAASSWASFRVANDSGSLDRIRRPAATASSWPSEEFSVVWRVYHHVRTTTQYQTYFVFAEDAGFTGGDEYTVAFAGIAALDLHFGIGSQGNDTYHASAQPVINRWYYMAYRVRKRATNDYEQLFYPDLPDTSIVISRNRTAPLTHAATSSLDFGSVPYINNEGIDGSMSNMWIFKGALPIQFLAKQARSNTLVDDAYRQAVWAQIPAGNAGDLLDKSGHGHHFVQSTDAGNGFTTWANGPGANHWREPVGRYAFDASGNAPVTGCLMKQVITDNLLLQNGTDGILLQGGSGSCGGGAAPSIFPVNKRQRFESYYP